MSNISKNLEFKKVRHQGRMRTRARLYFLFVSVAILLFSAPMLAINSWASVEIKSKQSKTLAQLTDNTIYLPLIAKNLFPYSWKEVGTFGTYTVASVQTADLDSDNDTDLVLASEENDSIIQVYENLGNGTFRNSGHTFPYSSPDQRLWNFGITVADFNNDKLPDIASADAWAGLNIYLNQGDLAFVHNQRYVHDGYLEYKGVAAADLDNDGDIDLIVGEHNSVIDRGDRVLLNDGTGWMVDTGQSIGDDITWDIYAIDINQDHAPDYISVNRYAYEPTRLHLNDGQGYFPTSIDIPDAYDNSMDVKCFAHNDYTYCFIANAEGDIQRMNKRLVFDQNGQLIVNDAFGQAGPETKEFCLVDLNYDSLLDLVSANYNWGSIVNFSYNDNGLLQMAPSIPLFSLVGTSAIGCSDFNGDGIIDFVVGVQPNGVENRTYHLLLGKPEP